MWMKLRKSVSREPARPTRTPRRFIPRLQPLEDRLAPATFTVNTTLDSQVAGDGKLSLREAIHRANNLAGPDVVVVPAGVYKIALPGPGEQANATGDFDITDSVTIRGAGPGKTVIDGQQLDRVFDGTTPGLIRVVLQGMTIRNGAAVAGDTFGGGIRIDNVNLVVRDCALTGNRSFGNGGGIAGMSTRTHQVKLIGCTVARNVTGDDGGGIAVSSPGVLTVADSTFRRNQAGDGGGGLFALTATLTRITVSGNTAEAGGGGIQVGTLTLTDSTVSGNSASNGGGIHAGFLPGGVTLTGSTISGNSASTAGGGIFAEALTLRTSTVSGNTTGGDGGGIWAPAPTLTRTIVSGNTASGLGGGIHSPFSFTAAKITRSTIGGNAAGISGGGIWADTAELTRCMISDNTAGGDGGGVRALGTTLINSTVRGNTAVGQGGGVWADQAASLENCALTGNAAGSFGGGLRLVFGTGNLLDCIVEGNRADSGGGINANILNLTRSTVSGNRAAFAGGGVAATTATLTNSTVSGNTAGVKGGGVKAFEANLLNCTVVENLAQTGGGLFHEPGGTFSVRNSIVALNLVRLGGTGPDLSGDFTTGGHNLIGDGTGTNFVDGLSGDLVGTALDPINPMLNPLANNGGPTKTHKLLAASKAIDAGDNANLPPTDQRGSGFARKRDGNSDGRAVVDIGAFER